MKEKSDLYIPAYVPDRKEIISGFRKEELVIIACVSAVAIIACLIMGIQQSSYLFFTLIFSGGAIAATIVTVRLDRAGENLIHQIRIYRNYRKAQKRFQYFYKDIYAKEQKHGENKRK